MRHNLLEQFIQKLFSFILLAGVLTGASLSPAAAQTMRRGTKNPVPPAKRQKSECTGWTGVITYKKTMNESGMQKYDGRTDGEHRTFRRYLYTGTIRLKNWEADTLFVPLENVALKPAPPAVQVSFSDEQKRFSRSKRSDTCGANAGAREQWTNSQDSTNVIAFAEGAARNFSLFHLSGEFYNLSFTFPDAEGVQETTRTNASGGYCNDKFNGVKTDAKTSRQNVRGQSFSVDGQKVDPKNPDVLAGSVTKDISVGSTTGAITVTWNLRRCPSSLELEAVEFDEKEKPDAASWKRFSSVTNDGNLVRIRARVTNYSGVTKTPFLTFYEMKTGYRLPGGEINAAIAPGETREVSLVLDTRGMSREPNRLIKVEMTEASAPRQEKNAELLISPPRGMVPIEINK